tara:strand:+ start:358 stop:534 length:177 start_codon:yes stop_codon:yes gene_type:complete
MNRNYLEIFKFLIGIVFIGLVIYESFVTESEGFFPPYILYGIFSLYAVVFYLSKATDK